MRLSLLFKVLFGNCVVEFDLRAITLHFLLRLLHYWFCLNFSGRLDILAIGAHFQELRDHLVPAIDALIHVVWNATLDHHIIE